MWFQVSQLTGIYLGKNFLHILERINPNREQKNTLIAKLR